MFVYSQEYSTVHSVNYSLKYGKAYGNLMDVMCSPWGYETKRRKGTWGSWVFHSKDKKNRKNIKEEKNAVMQQSCVSSIVRGNEKKIEKL